MEEILHVGHYVALNQALLKEWQKHRSNYSLQWLSYMQRRGKVRLVRCPETRNRILTNCVNGTDAITSNQKDAVRKDFLLLHCAWASDELVSSMDEKMRKLLSILALECAEIGSVTWVNPARAEDKAVGWVKAGARTEEDRKLRSWNAPT
ncbi:hypothetical protein [Streptomyces sp. SLBN-118]|uniref:hypothetical protein n=1 Tax=Streptomyces sp. SLBN-118 TaxID=2768454 RepID=UPI001152FBB2|nr:hypothetical protein [Streptomyces sp. SLBN-118]